MALAVSMTLPPPIAATTSAPCSRAAAVPARASSTVGSPATGNTAAGNPSPASSPACRAGSAPVHTSTRDPSPARRPGSSAARPAPKTMRPAVANSKARHDEPLAQPSLSAGNTTEYLVDARGAAIIPATESRQAA